MTEQRFALNEAVVARVSFKGCAYGVVVARTVEEKPRYDIKAENGAIHRDVTPDNIFSAEKQARATQ